MASKKAARDRAQNLIPGGTPLGGPGADKSPSITLRLPASTRAHLDALAAAAGMGRSKYVRGIIDQHLAQHPEP